MRVAIEVSDFDLDNTFKPSFISSLCERVAPARWVKIAGHLGKQLEIRQPKPGLLEVRCKAELAEVALQRRALLETGL